MQADEFKSHHKDDNGERSGKHFPEFAVSLFTQGEAGQKDVNAPSNESPLSLGDTDFVETIFRFGGDESGKRFSRWA